MFSEHTIVELIVTVKALYYGLCDALALMRRFTMTLRAIQFFPIFSGFPFFFLIRSS